MACATAFTSSSLPAALSSFPFQLWSLFHKFSLINPKQACQFLPTIVGSPRYFSCLATRSAPNKVAKQDFSLLRIFLLKQILLFRRLTFCSEANSYLERISTTWLQLWVVALGNKKLSLVKRRWLTRGAPKHNEIP